MQHFLRDVGVYTEMVDQLEKAKTLDWELYAVNSSAHPVEWTPWTHADKIRVSKIKRWRCEHPVLRRLGNQHGHWWKCQNCEKQVNFIAEKKDGTFARPIWFVGVVQIPVNYQDDTESTKEPMIIMDSGCRRSVAGKDWHVRMVKWTQSLGLTPSTRRSTRRSNSVVAKL